MHSNIQHHSHPLLTVGLFTYNGSEYLEQTLVSLLRQSFQHFIINIGDNASSDRTEEICRRLSSRHPDKINYDRHGQNLGSIANSQFLLKKCRTKYFMWSSDHDWFAPDLLEKCVAELESTPTAVLAYPEITRIDKVGGTIKSKCSPDQWSTAGLTPSERFERFLWDRVDCIMFYGVFRTESVQKITMPRIVGPDHVFLCEAILAGDFVFVGDTCLYYRQNRDPETELELKERYEKSLKVDTRKVHWPLLRHYAYAVLRATHIPIRERIRMLDDIVWRFQMELQDQLRKESRFGAAILYQLNRVLSLFRKRTIPWHRRHSADSCGKSLTP